MPLPELTEEQRAQARRKALAARSLRAEMLAEVAAGRRSVTEVLAAARTERALGRTKVSALLKALPGVGPVGARTLLGRVGIAPERRVGALTARQREEISEVTRYPIRWRSTVG
jgi:transposase